LHQTKNQNKNHRRKRYKVTSEVFLLFIAAAREAEKRTRRAPPLMRLSWRLIRPPPEGNTEEIEVYSFTHNNYKQAEK